MFMFKRDWTGPLSLYNLVVEKTGLFLSFFLRSVGASDLSVVSSLFVYSSSPLSRLSSEPWNLIGEGFFFDGFPSTFDVNGGGLGASISNFSGLPDSFSAYSFLPGFDSSDSLGVRSVSTPKPVADQVVAARVRGSMTGVFSWQPGSFSTCPPVADLMVASWVGGSKLSDFI